MSQKPTAALETNIAMQHPCSLFGRLLGRQRAEAKPGAHASSGSRGPTRRVAQTRTLGTASAHAATLFTLHSPFGIGLARHLR